MKLRQSLSLILIIVLLYVPLFVGNSYAAKVIKPSWQVKDIDISDKYVVWSEYFPTGRWNIWFYDFGTNRSCIIRNTPDEDFNPRIYKDGIVFVSKMNPYEESRRDSGDVIYYNIKKGNWLEIANSSKTERNPDIWGSRIVYVENTSKICIFNLTTKSFLNLTLDNISVGLVRIFGNYVVFDGGVGAERNIYLWDIQNNTVINLTNTSGRLYLPTIWGYDVYWYNDYESVIYRYDITKRKLEKLNFHSAIDTFDVYGENIVFSGYDENNFLQIYVYNIYLNKLYKLTSDAVDKFNPVIYGNEIAYYDELYFNIYINNLSIVSQDLADDDMDGLCNAHEKDIGTDPKNPDSDGDGFSDYEEFKLGTSPNDPDSYPAHKKEETCDCCHEFQFSSLSDLINQTMVSDINLNLSIMYVKVNGTKTDELQFNRCYPDFAALKINKSADIYTKLILYSKNENISNVSAYWNDSTKTEKLILSQIGNDTAQTDATFQVNSSSAILYFIANDTFSNRDVVILYLYINEDEDGDKLTVTQELNNCTFPILYDSDGDGYSDYAELMNNSDPLDPKICPNQTQLQINISVVRDIPRCVNVSDVFNVSLKLYVDSGYTGVLKEEYPRNFRLINVFAGTDNITNVSIDKINKTILLSWIGKAKLDYTLKAPMEKGIYNFTGKILSPIKKDVKGNSTIIVKTPIKPIANFTFYPKEPKVNETVTFNASLSYDPDGCIVSYEWNFGDGTITLTNESIVNHTYSYAGDYIVTLAVIDNDGLKSSISELVNVSYTASERDALKQQILDLVIKYIISPDDQLKQQILEMINRYILYF